MEQTDKIFGMPCTASAVQSFSDVAASRISSNPFAAVTAVTTSLVFGQSPAFTPAFAANANAVTSSASLPFASFNFSAPSFAPQNSTHFFTSAREPSNESTGVSNDSVLLFGKPVSDEAKKEQSEQEVKIQLEPKRRWNAKSGDCLTLYFLWYELT